MPTEELNGIWRKTEERPRHVDMRITWPDDDAWKTDPLSTVFLLETRDADAQNAEWQSLGRFATKAKAQECADEYLGASHANEWTNE